LTGVSERNGAIFVFVSAYGELFRQAGEASLRLRETIAGSDESQPE
jgi:hypothetical protein